MSLIYHLVLVKRWQAWPKNTPYLPAEYEKDGFIHCTAGDELLLKVANRFCRQIEGDFVLLVIDTTKLLSPVKWEHYSDEVLDSIFPHIYGPIQPDAIVEVHQMQRTADGTFVGWSKS
ncbi:unnamed protein product [Rotaria sordida]|uniref:DUF952 domain-containing protein n=1 Tax=Rotaria sordida TaxID=392033 RepID=A0A815YZX0_9BILA|nr:unnamed protein product [Rotaria sordida]CAF1512935.1 unnamed protein product [Rotaria sordida]CAF1577452.1 unnamed protein product [Rotaria sordida]CAF3941321.1 unnamed protein product [Rotaria sordida]